MSCVFYNHNKVFRDESLIHYDSKMFFSAHLSTQAETSSRWPRRHLRFLLRCNNNATWQLSFGHQDGDVGSVCWICCRFLCSCFLLSSKTQSFTRAKKNSWRAIREGLYRVHLLENMKWFQAVEFDRESWWFIHWHWLLIPKWSRSARTLRSLAPGRFLTCTSKFYVSVDYAPVWISCRLAQKNVGTWLVVSAVVSRPLSETFLKITEDHHIILHLQYSSVFTFRLVPVEATQRYPELFAEFWPLDSNSRKQYTKKNTFTSL